MAKSGSDTERLRVLNARAWEQSLSEPEVGERTATEAVELARYMASEEFGTMFSNLLGQISPIPGVSADPNSVPVLSQFTDLMNEHETTPYIMLVGFRWEQPTGSVALQNALQGMMQGDLTPQEVAEEVQTQIASWYEPFQN